MSQSDDERVSEGGKLTVKHNRDLRDHPLAHVTVEGYGIIEHYEKKEDVSQDDKRDMK